MRFPETFIDDLRRQADIVRVISDYVPLKKKGANWMACCPFHKEKSPSFGVNPAREMYKCFGCGEGGNVFTFVMKIENVSFPEAVKLVAEKTGVPLPEPEGKQRSDAERRAEEERRRTIERVLELNAVALSWWESQLQADTPEARAAREYVARRGISEETRAAFRLGFAPDRWDALLNHLRAANATDKELEASGLVVKKEQGGFYDRFRGRLIFPVLDVRGRAVAFGGRTLVSEGEPKYLNSPETVAYTKGRHLYGLHQALAEIRKRKFVILVEGYLDLVIPYQHGVRNMVASLGTALTAEQARLLGRFARKIVINYDGDKAGRAAAKRATEVLLAEDFEVKVLVLPDDADPDEFIRSHGVEEYQRRRGAADPFINFILDEALRERNLGNPADKQAALDEALPFVRLIKSPVGRLAAFDETMVRLAVDPSLRAGYAASVQANSKGASPARAMNAAGARSSNEAAAAPRPRVEQPTVAERQLLELLVNDEDLRRDFLPQIAESDYADAPSDSVFAYLKRAAERGTEVDLAAFAEELPDDSPTRDFVALLQMSSLPPELERAEGEADDLVRAKAESCLAALRLVAIDKRLRRIVAEIAAAQRAGDSEALMRLTSEDIELKRRRQALLPRLSDYTFANSTEE